MVDISKKGDSMKEQTFTKGVKLAIQTYSLFMIKEWNEELIEKFKKKEKEFKRFIQTHKEVK